MVKFSVVTAALLLPLAACGGSDDSSDEGSEAATTQVEAPTDDGGTAAGTSPDVTTASPEEDDGSGDAEGSGPSTAVLTIGGETYNFSTDGAVVAQCKTDLFGIFSAQLPMADGDGNIGVVALREGTDPAVVEQVNAVTVSIGDEDWIADESSGIFDASDALQPGMSQVDSVEIDGRTVRGTATFVRELSVFGGGEPETATGTFEATCGEERLS